MSGRGDDATTENLSVFYAKEFETSNDPVWSGCSFEPTLVSITFRGVTSDEPIGDCVKVTVEHCKEKANQDHDVFTGHELLRKAKEQHDEKHKAEHEVPTGPVWLRPGGQHEPDLRDIQDAFTMQDGTIVMKCDPVDRPAHYQQFGVEVIDIIRNVLGPEGFRAYCIGNELKYRLRAGDKGDASQDMAKAMKYREFRETK